jgi:hypothetical protein
LAADQEVVGHDHNNDATGQRQYVNLSETSAVHEDGYHLGVEGDTSGLGLNILGFDCIAVGTVSLIKINDDDDDDD